MKLYYLPIAVLAAALAILAPSLFATPTSSPSGSSLPTVLQQPSPTYTPTKPTSPPTPPTAPPTATPTTPTTPAVPARPTPPVTVPVIVPTPPAPTTPSTQPAQTRPQTVVSLTFDDGNVDQLAAASIMSRYNLHGTFYVITGYVGASGYFSRNDLNTLAAAGNEIAGHTVTHPDLTTLPIDEVKRQICDGRVTLASWGFTSVRSFAYPFAATNPQVEAAVAGCGFNSARMLGDIKSRFGCSGCGYAETIPPADPYYTKALDQVDSTWTLQDLKNSVTNAERSGGWVQLTFHNICASSCSDLAISPTIFTQFAQWLSARAATMNTVTKTVGDVIGGSVKPLVAGPSSPGVSTVANPSLETPGPNGTLQCWFQAPYGNNTATFSTVSPGHTGNVASKVTMTGYVSGDAKILPTFDLGSCAPGATEGHSYSLRSWYTSTVVTQFAVYLRTPVGTWQYWTSSPWFAPSTTWTEAEWTTPAIPAGFNGISFGLNIFSNGELVTDDYSIYDSVGAPPASSVPPTPPAAPPAALTAEPAPPVAQPSLETPAPLAPAEPPAEAPTEQPSPSPTDPPATDPVTPPAPPTEEVTPPEAPSALPSDEEGQLVTVP